MVRKVEVVSGAGNKVTFKSYADDDLDMSIQVEHFTRVLDEEAVIQIYNFMKEHYNRIIASKLSNCTISIKDRLMPDFGREKVCYVNEFEVMKKERDDYKFKYETWKEDYEDLEECYEDLHDKYDAIYNKWEALKDDLDATNRVLENWKAVSNEWRDKALFKHDEVLLEKDKVKLLLNYLKREGYEAEFVYNDTALKVKRS